MSTLNNQKPKEHSLSINESERHTTTLLPAMLIFVAMGVSLVGTAHILRLMLCWLAR